MRASCEIDLVLYVDWHSHMRDTPIGEGGAAGESGDVLSMRGAHDASVVDGDVHVELVELDVLLRIGLEQIVELQAGDREHRRLVELRVIKPVQEVNAARS